MKKKELDVVFLLDRSGSMGGMETDTIGGYNSYLNNQRKNKFNTYITTVLFDDKYEVLHDRCSIKDVKDITNKEYYVRGCTALMDAIGKTIKNIEHQTDNKVLFVITTDGLENASKEYTKNSIKRLIKKHQDWEFIYLGADIDSYGEAASIGISRKNTYDYTKSKEGTRALFKSVSKAVDCMYTCGELDESWKDELKNNQA